MAPGTKDPPGVARARRTTGAFNLEIHLEIHRAVLDGLGGTEDSP